MSSSKKFTSSKHLEDEGGDSGLVSDFISEPLSGEIRPLSSENPEPTQNLPKDSRPLGLPRECDSTLSEEDTEFDSGIVSEFVSGKVSDICAVKGGINAPATTVLEEKRPESDVLPLELLFQQDEDGETQLHIAAIHGCTKSISTLIRVCPETAWLNVPNDEGQTALHLSAHEGHAMVTRMLLIAGLSLGTRDYKGETPLHKAVARGHNDCLKMLLAPIHERPCRQLSSILNQKNYDGQTCIHLAAMSGNIEVLQTLVYYGADVNAREGLAGWTALHCASAGGDATTARYLLTRARASAEVVDYAGKSARRLARRTAAASAFTGHEDSDEETEDEDDDEYDDSEPSILRISERMNAINVA